MARISTAARESISLGRLDPSSAYNDMPQAISNASTQISNMANKIQEIELQKQEALSTIEMNKSHAEMGRDLQTLHDDIEKQYADDPKAAEQAFNDKAQEIKGSYENRFANDVRSQAKFSSISETLYGQARESFNSWKSAQELTNATKSYRTTQATRVQMAGDSKNLSELYKVYREANDDFETTKNIFNGTNFDASADHRGQLSNITKEFLNGQIDKSPGSIEEYLKDPMIEHHLTEAEKSDYKKLAKATIKANQAEADEATAIDNLFSYYDTYSQAKDGKVSIGQINSKIEFLRKSGAPAGRIEQWLQLREMVHGDQISAAKAAQKEIDDALTAEAKAQREEEKKIASSRAMIDVTTRYNHMFLDKNGEPIKGAAPLEESAKLLSDITKYQREGLLGDVTGLQKAVIASIDKNLSSTSKVYKTKKAANPIQGNVPNWLWGGQIEVPIDDYNAGLKAVIDMSDKAYGDVNVAGDSVKALAVSDYIANYQKYKQMGMSDKDIRLNVFSSAQKVQRGQVQSTVDQLYRQKTMGITSGKYAGIIENAANQYKVAPGLVNAIVKMESGFNPNATSSVGAQGLMQLMPATAKGLGVRNPYDPIQNINGGTKHIAGLLARYNGNVRSAVAAYNAGGGNVDDFLYGTNKAGNNPNRIKTKDGVPPFKETQNYVNNVLAYVSKTSTGGSITASKPNKTLLVSNLKAKGYSESDIAEYIKAKGL